MKTIFITSFHQLISRNILSSLFFEALSSRKNMRIIIFCPQKKEIIFKENFGKENVIIEGVVVVPTWRERFLRYLSLASINTESLRIKRSTELRGSGRIVSLFLSNYIGRSFVRFLSEVLTPGNFFTDYFFKYQPDLVFSTDPQNDGDSRMFATAKKMGVKTLGMVRSWDNLTTKGLIRIKPNHLIVHNLLLKDEAVALNDFRESEISVVGIPHYDRYLSYIAKDRISFYGEKGLNLDKKTILYVPTGDRYLGKNRTDFDVLSALKKDFSGECNILVRMPPGDVVSSFLEKEWGSSVIFDYPGKKMGNIKNTELFGDDDLKLIDTIVNSDVVVSGPSTMVIDGVFFNRPVILVNFDGNTKHEFLDSVSRYFSNNHFVPVTCSGAVYISRDMNDLAGAIKDSLKNPDKRKWERTRLSGLECFCLDGKSSERLLSVVEKNLE